MARHFPNWIEAYMDYASYSEAPPKMHFWTAIGTLAGAIRRKVWFDQFYFKWVPNFYIVFVAPPGIIAKTTTMGIGMRLLKKVPGINFGPDTVTWQSLVKDLAALTEPFQTPDGEWQQMCAMTIASGEFGTLLKPADSEMIDVLVALWDGNPTFDKSTKGSGKDKVDNPWINIIGCTTPSWIAGNFPEYMIGGGFTSRCIFVYVDKKDKLVAYPRDNIPNLSKEKEKLLVQDLEHISLSLSGEVSLSEGAKKWGERWYANHYKNAPPELGDSRFDGYLARKQTHLHKLAMIISIAKRDTLIVHEEDFEDANEWLRSVEQEMPRVFSLIGRSNTSLQVDRFVSFIHKKGKVEYSQAYRYVHSYFPDVHDFESVVMGAIQAGYIKMDVNRIIHAVGEAPAERKIGS